MKNILTAITILSVAVLTSCNGSFENDPLSRKYSESTFKKDFITIRESQKFNNDSVDMLEAYVNRNRGNGNIIYEGESYNKILEKVVKEKEADRKYQQEMTEINDSILTIAMCGKGYIKQDYQGYLKYVIAFENKTDKDIREVSGSIIITLVDLHFKEDLKVKEVNVSVKEIPAHQIVKKVYITTNDNAIQLLNEGNTVANKEIKDLKVEWTGVQIIFVDGTEIRKGY